MIRVSEVRGDIAGGYAIDITGDENNGYKLSLIFQKRKNAELVKKIIEADNDSIVPDIEHIKSGEWLDVIEEEIYCPDQKTTITRTTETCSVCKTRTGFIGLKRYLFDSRCPDCGAYCGTEIENEKQKEEAGCGYWYKIEKFPRHHFCSRCGKGNRTKSDFCPNCGNKKNQK